MWDFNQQLLDYDKLKRVYLAIKEGEFFIWTNPSSEVRDEILLALKKEMLEIETQYIGYLTAWLAKDTK